MGCKIIFSPQAIVDLESVVRFIAKENPDAAARVGSALIDRVSILENFPLVGSLYPKQSRCSQTGCSSLHHFLSPEAERELRRHFALLAWSARQAGVLKCGGTPPVRPPVPHKTPGNIGLARRYGPVRLKSRRRGGKGNLRRPPLSHTLSNALTLQPLHAPPIRELS